jgi:hypothetical protein
MDWAPRRQKPFELKLMMLTKIRTGTHTAGFQRPSWSSRAREDPACCYLLFLVSYCLMFLMKWVFFRPLCLGDPDACLVLQSKKLGYSCLPSTLSWTPEVSVS